MSQQLAVEIPNIEALTHTPLLSVYGAAEFLDNPAPQMRWVIPGLLPSAVPSVLASKGGLGKSFLMLQLCVALAAGKPFLDYAVQPPMATVYFGLEDSKDTFHRRFRAVVENYRFCNDWSDEDEANLRRNFACPFINWKSKDATTYLPDLTPSLERILETNTGNGLTPGVMVIDTLARVSEGDENTVGALRPILSSCNRIAEHGYTPVLLHHVAKGQDGAKGKAKEKPLLADRMSTEWVRGSSAIVDNFRCILQFAAIREDEAHDGNLDGEKAKDGGYLVFGVTKLNGGQKGAWRLLEQSETGGWFVPEGAEKSLAFIRGTKAVAALSQRLQVLQMIHSMRYAHDLDRRAIEAKFWPEADAKTAGNRLRQVINKLRSDGYLNKAGNALTPLGMNQIKVTGEVTHGA